VRLALRRAGVDRDEIRTFSSEAFGSDDDQRVRQICGRWATLETLD
jgi:hypothetical protein